RRHTRSDRDWSSDVCSSDLPGENAVYAGSAAGGGALKPTVCIHSFSLPFKLWRHLFTEGAHVVTPAIRHVPPQCIDPKTKNRSRSEERRVGKEGRARGARGR